MYNNSTKLSPKPSLGHACFILIAGLFYMEIACLNLFLYHDKIVSSISI